MVPRRNLVLGGLVVLALLLAGCAGGTEQVSNNVNSFRYTSEWKGFSGTKEYDWQNDRTHAEVSLSGTPTGGSLSVSVRDAAGATVYSVEDLQPGARSLTQQGQPGTWHIVLRFNGFAGQTTVSVRANAGPASS